MNQPQYIKPKTSDPLVELTCAECGQKRRVHIRVKARPPRICQSCNYSKRTRMDQGSRVRSQ